MDALGKAGVPAAEYRDPGAAFTDPHLLQRGVFETIAGGAGEFMGVNAPWKMSGAAATSMQREIPAIGAHRNEVLSRVLGLRLGATPTSPGQEHLDWRRTKSTSSPNGEETIKLLDNCFRIT